MDPVTSDSENSGDAPGGQTLPERVELYRLLFETSNDALFIEEDVTNRILEVNARACELLGYTRDELRRLAAPDLLPPDAPRPTLGSGLPELDNLSFETVNRRKDGRLVPVEVNARRIVIGARAIWLVDARDITERRRLKRSLDERGMQLARLNQLAQALARSLDVAQLGQMAVDKIRVLADLDAAGIALIDEASEWLEPIYHVGVSEPFAAHFVAQQQMATQLINLVAAIGHPLIVEDVQTEPDVPPNARQALLDEGLHTLLFFTILAERQTQGIFIAAYRQVTAVDETTLQTLEAAVGHLGQALSNARRYQREQRRATEQQALVDLLSVAIGSRQLGELLPALAERASQLLQADGAYLTHWDEETQVVTCAAASPPYQDLYPTFSPIPASQPTLTRAVLETGQPIAVFDVFDSPYVDPAFAAHFKTRSLLALPLLARTRRLGALLIGSDAPRRFTRAEIELGQLAANLIALGIDNAQLLEAQARQRRQAETLRQVAASLTLSLELNAVLDTILDQLGRVIDYSSASIQLLRGGRLELVAGRGFPDIEAARRAIYAVEFDRKVQQMIASRRAWVIPDTRLDADWIQLPGQEYIRSWIGAPLLERDQLIGVLNVDHRQVDAYDEEAAALVTSFAHQAAIAITNARLYQEERDRVAHLAVLNDIVNIASSKLELGEVYQALADNMVRVIGGDDCYINAWDVADQRVVPVAHHSAGRGGAPLLPLPASKVSLTRSTLATGQPIAVEDAFDSPYSDPQIAALFPARSKLALPLIADGKKLGAVIIGFNQPHAFSEEEIARSARAAELVAVAVAKAHLHADLQRRARDLASDVAARTQELRVANEQLRSLDRLKSSLITQISHEFRTPVTNLTIYLRLLTSGWPEKRDQYLAVLNEQTEMLKRLIESVTVYAELDLTPDAGAHLPWPIGQALERAAAAHQAEASAKSIRLEALPGDADLRVRANPQRIDMALRELVSNAIAYTDAGGRVTIRFERAEEARREWVRVSISDSGIGIPANELPHVFAQFFRGRQRALQVRGIGMGLALVQAIAEMEGGRVTAESAGEGQGSTFRLWLPRAE
ncbi:MAG TPA: GAF domain-containing protein [Anaerolineae bacterium]|nr:GAF domain-containing protein [Anaerolineae bacterium]